MEFLHFGIVQLYYGRWGNICDDYYYNLAEANVICRQLGYTGASSYSRAGLTSYGSDSNPIIIDDVNCGNINYLTLSQCSFYVPKYEILILVMYVYQLLT